MVGVLIRFTLIGCVPGRAVGVPPGAMVCVDLAYRKGGPILRRALDG